MAIVNFILECQKPNNSLSNINSLLSSLTDEGITNPIELGDSSDILINGLTYSNIVPILNHYGLFKYGYKWTESGVSRVVNQYKQ